MNREQANLFFGVVARPYLHGKDKRKAARFAAPGKTRQLLQIIRTIPLAYASCGSFWSGFLISNGAINAWPGSASTFKNFNSANLPET